MLTTTWLKRPPGKWEHQNLVCWTWLRLKSLCISSPLAYKDLQITVPCLVLIDRFHCMLSFYYISFCGKILWAFRLYYHFFIYSWMYPAIRIHAQNSTSVFTQLKRMGSFNHRTATAWLWYVWHGVVRKVMFSYIKWHLLSISKCKQFVVWLVCWLSIAQILTAYSVVLYAER